jgi:hypothetical protein
MNENIKAGADIHAGDGGYSEGTQEKYDEFVKTRNQSLDKSDQSLVYRLRKRAEIRRNIKDRKSVQEGAPDRIADLLEEAANEIERLRNETRTD